MLKDAISRELNNRLISVDHRRFDLHEKEYILLFQPSGSRQTKMNDRLIDWMTTTRVLSCQPLISILPDPVTSISF